MRPRQLNKRPLSDQVTDILRQRIVSGLLPAGAPLKQEELKDSFGISMGSLREALRTLHSDGLVTIAPNRGAQVSDLSADEAEDIYDIRLFLEIGALELALPGLTAKDLNAAEKILVKMDAAREAAKWSGLNRQFHEALYQPAGRPRLLSLIGNLHDNVARYLSLYLDTMNFQDRSQNEHHQLLEALGQKDVQSARQILRIHLEAAKASLISYLKAKDTEAYIHRPSKL